MSASNVGSGKHGFLNLMGARHLPPPHGGFKLEDLMLGLGTLFPIKENQRNWRMRWKLGLYRGLLAQLTFG